MRKYFNLTSVLFSLFSYQNQIYSRDEFQAGKNSPIFAYYGSARELSLNLTGDKPYEVIITVQRLLLTHITPSVQDRTDFDCTVTMPTMENTTTHTNISTFQCFTLKYYHCKISSLTVISVQS